MNLDSDSMAYIRHQGIAVDDDNDSYPENIPYEVPHLVNAFNWKPEGIIS